MSIKDAIEIVKLAMESSCKFIDDNLKTIISITISIVALFNGLRLIERIFNVLTTTEHSPEKSEVVDTESGLLLSHSLEVSGSEFFIQERNKELNNSANKGKII